MGKGSSLSSGISRFLCAEKNGKLPFTCHGKARYLVLHYCLAKQLSSLRETVCFFFGDDALPLLLRAVSF